MTKEKTIQKIVSNNRKMIENNKKIMKLQEEINKNNLNLIKIMDEF